MDDLINQKEAIKIAEQHHDFYKYATLPTDKARRDELLDVMCWLNELPTVEAIPVVWIEEYIKRVLSFDGYYSDLRALFIHLMLNDWRKEQK